MKKTTGVLIGVLIGVSIIFAWWMAPPTESWVDMAKSHTGQDIPVNRVVEFRFGEGELSYALSRSPTNYSFEFTNPADGKKISWQGEKYVLPVLLDVVNGSAWLVINSSRIYADVKKYGCPEIDYVFLKYSADTRRWIAVEPNAAPPELQMANLSYGYAKYLISHSRVVDADQIASQLRSMEVSTSGHLNTVIPRTFQQWKYKSKRGRASSRVLDDCRPPLDQPVDYIAAFGPSKSVQLEVLSSDVFVPELLIQDKPNSSQSPWGNYSWDKERALACKGRLNQADDQDQRLATWQRFVEDTTGKRIFPNSYSRFCDADVVWLFGNGMTEPGRVVVNKVTNSGEIIYKVSFTRPTISLGSAGSIRFSTFREIDGYVYFDWVSFDSGGYEWRVKHSSRLRFKEPSTLPAKPTN